MSQMTETQELIAKTCDEIKELLLDKNRKYGDSAIHPKRVFSKADAIEQINVRLDDKISRLMSSQGDEDEDVEFDLIGYLVLKRVARMVHSKQTFIKFSDDDGFLTEWFGCGGLCNCGDEQ